MSSGADEETREDGQVMGTMIRISLPAPGLGANLDSPPYRLDAGANHVESDTASGYLRYRVRG